jgi:hypothetical protein
VQVAQTSCPTGDNAAEGGAACICLNVYETTVLGEPFADFTLASSGAARQEQERHGVESNDGLPFATAALASALGVGAVRPATGLPNGGDLREPDKPTRITGRWRWAGRRARQIG